MSCALEERMDEQRIQDRVSETTEKAGTMASDAAKQAGAAMQAKLDQGKAMMQDAQTSAATLARQASEAGRQAMAQAGGVGARRRARGGHPGDESGDKPLSAELPSRRFHNPICGGAAGHRFARRRRDRLRARVPDPPPLN